MQKLRNIDFSVLMAFLVNKNSKLSIKRRIPPQLNLVKLGKKYVSDFFDICTKKLTKTILLNWYGQKMLKNVICKYND